jgi:sterol desaturase/sphingolipid hydroxylase (fatty acid hydroxylase superfamily)
VTATPAATVWLFVRGAHPEVAVALTAIASSMAIALLERHLSYEQAWSESRGDVAVDAIHLLISTVGVFAAFQIALAPFIIRASIGVWPERWPLAIQIVLGLLLVELGPYLLHRLMHETRTLWRLHAVHHGARRLYALNSSRNHPLDAMLLLITGAAPLVWLGAGTQLLTIIGSFALTHLALQHSNVDVRLGPMNAVLAGPEIHRWHHSRQLEEANGNYAHLLIVWDLLFRTRIAPAGRKPPVDVGLAEGNAPPERYLAHLAAPFTSR